MAFRFRRRFGPRGLKINLSKRGISSVSVGSPGASVNIPVGREGGTRYTVGLPGSGMSWSHQEKSSEPPAARGVARALAPFCALFVLVTVFVAIGTSEKSVKTESVNKKTAVASPAVPGDLKVTDVRLGPVVCTPDKTSLQCTSTGAFIFFTLTNTSASAVCSVRGEVGYVQNGTNHRLGSSESLFLGLYDNDDQCLSPGESWSSAGGLYLPNTNWAQGGFSSPSVVPTSVESDKWW